MVEDDGHGFTYIATELCEYTLNEWLDNERKAKGKTWSKHTPSLVKDVLSGLSFLKRKDILHRDLKVGFTM